MVPREQGIDQGITYPALLVLCLSYLLKYASGEDAHDSFDLQVWTMSKSYSYDSVVSAVLKVGSHNWNLLGDKLGLTEGEMSSATSNKPTDPGKLQAIINMKRDELGDRELVRQLLDACEKIPQPILGQVLQRLDPLYNPEASVLNIGGRIVSPNQPGICPILFISFLSHSVHSF